MSIMFTSSHCLARLSCCIHRSISTSCLRPATVAFKGAPSVGKKRFRQPANEDAEYLCKYVSGSNILKDGEDVRLKDDSEYPDWLWTMRIGEAKLEDLSPETTEYWELLEELSLARARRYQRKMKEDILIVGSQEKKRILYEQRIKFRALASEESEDHLGFRPEDYVPKYDKKLFLKPQESLHEEELLPDEFAAQNQMKFHKGSRADVVEPVKPVSKLRNRNMFMPF